MYLYKKLFIGYLKLTFSLASCILSGVSNLNKRILCDSDTFPWRNILQKICIPCSESHHGGGRALAPGWGQGSLALSALKSETLNDLLTAFPMKNSPSQTTHGALFEKQCTRCLWDKGNCICLLLSWGFFLLT